MCFASSTLMLNILIALGYYTSLLFVLCHKIKAKALKIVTSGYFHILCYHFEALMPSANPLVHIKEQKDMQNKILNWSCGKRNRELWQCHEAD